jgi:hypothetical protein
LVLLEPSDVLFFRDGRPMTGGLAGHGAAWPLPNVVNAAFHGALHRAEWSDVHPHAQHGRLGVQKDKRQFGSLLTAGPFPVRLSGTGNLPVASGNLPDAISLKWYFPRPADVLVCDNCSRFQIALRPTGPADQWTPGRRSSLPAPLSLAVANCLPPSKETGAFQWLERSAFETYISGTLDTILPRFAHLNDDHIFAAEFTVGIGMDPATKTQDQERIYSAHYLRLHPDWRLGMVAQCRDQGVNGAQPRDLLAELLPDGEGRVLDREGNLNSADDSLGRIIVGGQQRLCRAVRIPATQLHLPHGLSAGFHVEGDGADKRCFVKWVLLTPAIWPEIPDKSKDGRPMVPHPGGWLPNWVCPDTGDVLLETVSEDERRRRRRLNYEGKGYASNPPRTSRLVAALVPKAIPVTGWSFSVPDVDGSEPGAKTTHLAVPAGAVYYFETWGENAEDEAIKLAAALNWHGGVTNSVGDFTTIKNRRSTLAGEKGFGLGVCGAWKLYGEGGAA